MKKIRIYFVSETACFQTSILEYPEDSSEEELKAEVEEYKRLCESKGYNGECYFKEIKESEKEQLRLF